MTPISRRAGMSAGALQGYFPTKSELLAAVLDAFKTMVRPLLTTEPNEHPQPEGAT